MSLFTHFIKKKQYKVDPSEYIFTNNSGVAMDGPDVKEAPVRPPLTDPEG